MKRIALALIALVFLVGLTTFLQENTDINFYGDNKNLDRNIEGFETFSTRSDFVSYLESAPEISNIYTGGVAGRDMMEESTQPKESGGDGETTRVSETNVQVQGVDEPDIVKTDGETIFFSPEYYNNRKLKLLDPSPPENLSITSEIDKKGKMLLKEDVLVIFSRENIYGYDVSDPSSPSQKWKIDMNGSLAGARLYNNNVYMVIKEQIDYSHPCPIRPLKSGGESLKVACSSIYHPIEPTQTDVTYTAVSLDPISGEIKDDITFVGSSRDSTLYMSEGSIYTTYTHRKSREIVLMDFIIEESGLFPENIVDKIRRLKSYNISDRAKSVELQVILNKYYEGLNDDEKMEIENDLQNKFGNYSKEHKRELETTGIVKIGIDQGELDVENAGSVPGSPLNQFSMDEHEGNLRIATNIDFYGSGSENDVYVLNKDLEVTGSVEGLGKTERIYAVRFIGDQGYVVTFRRIDPFYVLDLSDPKNPEMKGELKLPGYSSYLHPLEEDSILGIGEEDGKVKVAVFDVSNPASPKVKYDYHLDEYYSSISQSHRAFLLDKKHGVFFLPGTKGGYIFSYDDGLELEKAVSLRNAKRAIYINDYLYIIAESGVSILDESNWDKVNEIEFESEYRRHSEPILDTR